MSIEILSQIPEEWTLGDTIKFLKTVPNCPASDGGALTYYFVKKDGTDNIFDVLAVASNDDFLITITTAVQAGLAAGEYSWRARFVKDSETSTIEQGSVKLNPDYSAAVETRSSAQQILDAIDDELAGKATFTQKRMKIRDREVEYSDRADLIRLRNYYASIVDDEEAEEDRKLGKANKKKIGIRLTNN